MEFALHASLSNYSKEEIALKRLHAFAFARDEARL